MKSTWPILPLALASTFVSENILLERNVNFTRNHGQLWYLQSWPVLSTASVCCWGFSATSPNFDVQWLPPTVYLQLTRRCLGRQATQQWSMGNQRQLLIPLSLWWWPPVLVEVLFEWTYGHLTNDIFIKGALSILIVINDYIHGD